MHTTGSPAITAAVAGHYRVEFSVSGLESSQFAVMLNGVAVAGGTYGSGAGTQQNDGQTILNVAIGDVLTLRNHTSAAAVTLQTLSGGTQTNVNASVIIEQLD